MSKLKIPANQDIVILTLGGYDYIQKTTNSFNPYVLFPGANGVTPGKELWGSTVDTECEIDESKYIRDNSNVNFYSIVGPRPRNIVRR